MSLEMHHAPPIPPVFDEAFRKHIIDRPGKIIFNGSHLTRRDNVRCLVRNISRQGADLEVSPFLSVADTFTLDIQGTGTEISCSLIRREDERVYIAFNQLLSSGFLQFIRRLGLDLSS